MACLGLAVHSVVGPIGIRVDNQSIADVDATAHVNAYGNAIALGVGVQLKIHCRLEVLKDSLSGSYLLCEWPQIEIRKRSNCI